MNSRKRKITKNTKQQQIVDEDISSIEEDEENKSKLPKIIEKSTDNESVSEKRLRMAEQILKKIQDAESSSDEEGVEDIVSHRLSKEQRKNAGIYFKKMASNYTDKKLKVEKSFTGHKMSPTCVTITKDETFIYSCGKDSKIIQYDIEAGMKFVINGKKKSENSPTHHYGTVYAVAVSPNGKYLATGGVDSTIKIYDCRTHDLIETFKGHRDTISCLQFHPMNSTLFSGSFDRTMKVWNLDDMLYMDTLFGHQSPINSLNMIHLGGTEYNPITSSDDITCRYWKINEETQLVYRNQHTSSIDSVSPGPQKNTFLSASQDGSVSLWSVNKKFPLHVQKDAHDGNWVISCAMYNQSDLLFSGSSNGKLNLYQYDDNSFKSINSVKVPGFINHIAVAPRSKLVVAAVGCEHKFGRWYFDKNITNRIDIIKL